MLGFFRQARTEVQKNYRCRLLQCPATLLAIPMLCAGIIEVESSLFHGYTFHAARHL